jgi:hypothetical protein
MAKKYIIELEAKADKALDGIEDLRKEIQALNKQVVDSNKKTEDGLKGVENASKSTAKGLRGIGLAIKAIGIGLVLEAFTKFKEILSENQKVTNFFNTTFEAFSIVVNDFVNFVINNFGTVVDFFKAIFEDPLQSVKDLGTAIKNNIIERFESALEVAGFLGTALKKLFQGDFAGALDAAQEAGKELIDVVTGVDDTFDKTVEVVTNVASAVSEYGKQVLNTAQANVELARTAEINAAINQGLIEQYDRQAEKLRQIRDDDRNTVAERIAANEELGRVLDEQQEKMLANAQAIVASAQAQFDKNQNDENSIALIQAKNELAAVEAQIEGFRSEQLANANALQREQLELTQTAIDAEAQRAINRAKFDAEQIEGEYLKLQALQSAADLEREIEVKRLTDKRNLYKQGTQAWSDANQELQNFQAQADQADIDRERKLQLAKEQLVSQAIGNLISIVGAQSKFGKGLAIVQAIRDTYLGANKALAAAPPPFNFIQAAAVIAGGIANVKEITSTQDPQPPNIAGARGGGSVAVAAPAIPSPPSFNVVGASAGNQLADAIAGQQNKPVKAFVVSREVTSAQELDRNAVRDASI